MLEEQAEQQQQVAMTILLQSVRQLASGLALPEVAMDATLASTLVDQTVGLTEAMVRRRVDQKFYSLRVQVLDDCLAPFCKQASILSSSTTTTTEEEDDDDDEEGSLLQVVQMASVALSDSLQLVDDTIRSILVAAENNDGSTSSIGSSANEDDVTMLKQAVEQSTKRFAMWLAGAMERVAGCESSDSKWTLEVKIMDDDKDHGTTEEQQDAMTGREVGPSMDDTRDMDTLSEVSQEQNDPTQLVETAILELLEELQNQGTSSSSSSSSSLMTLAIAEMCRVAERSVMDNISQSIAAHSGNKRKSTAAKNTLFQGNTTSNSGSHNSNNPTSERFRLAASRVLGLYAMDCGSKAAQLLCASLPELSKTGEALAPRTAAWQILEIIKITSQDCADLFGGSRRAGPLPDTLEDEYTSLTMPRMQQQRSSLVLDVERMFAEKVIVYPHPSVIWNDFQRNAVVTLVLKVAFKALIENCRLVTFSLDGYRQLMMDVEFWKFLLPHYIKDEFFADGGNARSMLESLLTDIIHAARDRCVESDLLFGNGNGDEEVNQARSAVREFMSRLQSEDRDILQKFVIEED
jgi:hypothetical protein